MCLSYPRGSGTHSLSPHSMVWLPPRSTVWLSLRSTVWRAARPPPRPRLAPINACAPTTNTAVDAEARRHLVEPSPSPRVSFIVEVAGDWTAQLVSACKQAHLRRGRNAMPRVVLDGPFPAPAQAAPRCPVLLGRRCWHRHHPVSIYRSSRRSLRGNLPPRLATSPQSSSRHAATGSLAAPRRSSSAGRC